MTQEKELVTTAGQHDTGSGGARPKGGNEECPFVIVARAKRCGDGLGSLGTVKHVR